MLERSYDIYILILKKMKLTSCYFVLSMMAAEAFGGLFSEESSKVIPLTGEAFESQVVG